MRYELLSAEARVYAHYKNEVNAVQHLFYGLDRGSGVYGDPRACPFFFYGLNEPVEVNGRFRVNRYYVRPALLKDFI